MIAKSKEICDTNCDAFIYTGNKLSVIDYICCESFVCAETRDALFFSCYFSPSKPSQLLEGVLAEIETIIKGKKEAIIGGDLNAKSRLWGSTTINEKGKIVEEWIEANDLVVINQGNIPTFKNMNGESMIDITLATASISLKIKNWKVAESEENMSLHRNIYFEITNDTTVDKPKPIAYKWRVTQSGMERIRSHCESEGLRMKAANPQSLSKSLKSLCNLYLLPRNRKRQKMTYWWSFHIAEIRATCNSLRRKITRGRKGAGESTDVDTAISNYKEAKINLKHAIKSAKKHAWENLLNDLNKDIWGKAYQIVTRKWSTGNKKSISEETTREQIRLLFPTVKIIQWQTITIERDKIPYFSEEEIIEATQSPKVGKAPGCDGIPIDVIKAAATHDCKSVMDVMNFCLRVGHIPMEWKTAKLVLVEKKTQDSTSKSYRPICLLNSGAKLLETLLKNRLEKELTEKGAIHENQYGFRKGKSTIDALNKILNIVDNINAKSYKSRGVATLLTLDIKNAFNSAQWQEIIRQLENKGISGYLIRMLQQYLHKRYIVTEHGERFRMVCGVPQGSILGPTLWNVFYDQVLREDYGPGCSLIGYADDLALVTSAPSKSMLIERMTAAAYTIKNKLDEMGIELATNKTEMVILAGRQKMKEVEFSWCNTNIKSTRAVKYMGVWLDKDARMTTHIRKLQEKA